MSNLYSQIKPALDKAIDSINAAADYDAYTLVEQKGKGGLVNIFLASHTPETEHYKSETTVILNIPLKSNKIADRTEAYSKLFVMIVKMGLQTMDLIVKDAKDKAKIAAEEKTSTVDTSANEKE